MSVERRRIAEMPSVGPNATIDETFEVVLDLRGCLSPALLEDVVRLKANECELLRDNFVDARS